MKNANHPVSSKSEIFEKTLSKWFEEKGEILILIWYPLSHGYDLELHQDLNLLKKRIADLEPGRSLSLIKDFYLPIRGVIDQEFITKALQYIDENEEFIVLGLEYKDRHKGIKPDFVRGDNHAELVEILNELSGEKIALGKDKHATWQEDHIEEFEAFTS